MPVVVDGVRALRAIPSHVLLHVGESRAVRLLRGDEEPARIVQTSCATPAIDLKPEGDRVTVTLVSGDVAGTTPITVRDERGREATFMVTVIR